MIAGANWFRELTPIERRTFWACFAGWALDAMDVQPLSFVIPALMGLWNIDKGQAGQLATVALLMSAVGGWLAGILSDRIGRVRTLQLTILWFARCSFLSGLAQNFGQLLVARGLMGLGFGGEWAAGAVLIGEIIRAYTPPAQWTKYYWLVEGFSRSLLPHENPRKREWSTVFDCKMQRLLD